ncbi:hypothetical protein N9M08_05895 [Porticoccaceae bacterium]|nr:hypothetical protein [Porticoccaceae bacterium]MDA8788782.1 hypothetical protein [Porticoccaceae bacterium]MDB2343063.1 hypothetical protein [Porticoccaceae bacterium]MDB2486783.1 hypothetical protein [Porticoccaceae bacterium]MDB2664420.1 hypothetical protein [Porticoccaceae bacterium]
MLSDIENDIIEAVKDLEIAYAQLMKAGRALVQSLDRGAFGVFCLDNAPSEQSLERLKQAFTNFTYDDGQDPKRTIKYPGAIGCSTESIRLAEKLNKEKKEFAVLFEHLSSLNAGKRKSFYKKQVSELFSRARQPLRFTTLSKICQKQATRLIPIADQYPEAITWHWIAQPESIITTTKDDVIKQLMEIDGESRSDRIQSHINNVLELPGKTLKKVQKKKNPTLRVTYQWGKGVSDRSIRQASMPILFRWDSSIELPRFKFYQPSPPKEHFAGQSSIKLATGQYKL